MRTAVDEVREASLLSRDFFLLLVSNLFMWTGFGCFFLFPLFLVRVGGTETDIGLLMGVMMLTAVFVRPQASKLVDRVGRRRVFAAGCSIMGAVSLAFILCQGPIASSFAPLLVLRLLFGVGFSLGVVASFTLAADLTPVGRLNEGIGLFGTTGLLGIALGPLTAEWILHRFGFTEMFALAGLTFAISLASLLGMRTGGSTAAGVEEGSFFGTLRQPVVLRMALIGTFFGVGFAAHGGFVTPYADSLGLFVSYYYGAYSAAAIVARIVGGKVGDRLGERRTIPVALVSTGCGFALLSSIESVLGLAASGFLAGIGHGIIVPGLMAATVRNVPSHSRGKATGVLTGGLDSGMFLGSLVLGFVGESMGYAALFSAAVGSMGAGLAISMMPPPAVSPSKP